MTQTHAETLRISEILDHASEHIGLRLAFGQPVEHEHVVLIPVAITIGGGGGGVAASQRGGNGVEQPSGGGLGGITRGIGAYAINHDQVRFIPAIDTTALAAMGLLAVCLAARAVARRA